MSLAKMLMQSGAIDSMARDLNIDQRTAQQGAMALLPAILAGMGRTQAGSSGLGGLGSIIGGLAGGGAGGGLLDLVLGKEPTPTQQGNDILGQIFGNKDVSRSVAAEAADASGIDQKLLKKMLPILAMAAVGYLANKRGGAGSGALGGLLGTLANQLAR